jgi:RimJ/RimL family protein N-acetyltransferase
VGVGLFCVSSAAAMLDAPCRQPELPTPRMRLRALRPSDAALIGLYCGHPEVARMTSSIPHPYPPGLAESFIERVLSGRAGEAVWALDTGDDEMNGLIGLIGAKPSGEGAAEIGYWVSPAFWGAGYASEAVEAVAAHARAEGLKALAAQAFQDNLASVKVLARAGFAYEGDGEIYAVARGGMVPTFRYRLELAGMAP